jgi:BlaI family transcriptional regulator, penicillinase repressor
VAADALTDLQLSVMKVLWHLGEGSVGEVAAALASDGRKLAPTTVATMLQRLAKQGWVEHEQRARHFVYRAKVQRREAAKSGLQRVLLAFFGGKVSALTAELLESEDLSPDDLEEMRRLIRKKAR